MRRRREHVPLNAEINVVSLIDVMMLLMVIFMITAPMMQGGVDVRLPRADARPLESRRAVVVTVDARGALYVDDVPVTEEALRARLPDLAARGGDGVYLRADERVPYGTVVRVLAMLRAGGLGDVGLVAEPERVR